MTPADGSGVFGNARAVYFNPKSRINRYIYKGPRAKVGGGIAG